MIRFNVYNRKIKKKTIWGKKKDKYLVGNIISFYGNFNVGLIMSDISWKEIILIDDTPNFTKQYRKRRDLFRVNGEHRFNKDAICHLGFDTPEDSVNYFNSTEKLNLKDFKNLFSIGKARFKSGKLYEIYFKNGVGYEYI